MTTAPTHDNWSWGIGESDRNYYDYWCYHVDGHYQIHVWWDAGNGHYAEMIPIEGENEDGDPIYGYAQDTEQFKSEEDALEYAGELMEKHA